MTLDLKLPDLYQEITVKIVDLAYQKGKEYFLPVIMWGDPKQIRFEMRLGKTLWNSIDDCLQKLEEDPLNGFMSLDKFETDEDLLCLKDRIITIRGIPDSKRSFVDKNGKITYPKVFSAEFQNKLEDAEKIGGDTYKQAVLKMLSNYSNHDCRLENSSAAKNAEIKKEEKEVEWVRKKREKQEKEDKKKAKLGEHCGW